MRKCGDSVGWVCSEMELCTVRRRQRARGAPRTSVAKLTRSVPVEDDFKVVGRRRGDVHLPVAHLHEHLPEDDAVQVGDLNADRRGYERLFLRRSDLEGLRCVARIASISRNSGSAGYAGCTSSRLYRGAFVRAVPGEPMGHPRRERGRLVREQDASSLALLALVEQPRAGRQSPAGRGSFAPFPQLCGRSRSAPA
jgi:hypothetical protein